MILETLNGLRYELSEYGLKLLSWQIESLSPRVESEMIDGRDGHVDIDTYYNGRSIRASFLMESESQTNYYVQRNEMYRLFNSRKYFYLINPKEPLRRWKVKATTPFILERVGLTTGKFELNLLSASPYAESTHSTLNPTDFFQVRIHENVQYSFQDTAAFSIWNDGDVNIDPREDDILITFKGESSNLKISNLTSQDVWEYSGLTAASDIITLEGIKSLKNGVSIFGQTNRKLIRLYPGWNEFVIEKASGPFEISFDFHFKYI